ncbi:MAG: cation diffusion facilitator family transporter [Clostridiales bacterium]|nr:cation diffusion facilitator family transporter [Clostridiales bacterium]
MGHHGLAKRQVYGRRSGVIGIILNFCLFVMKLLVGIFSGSIAVVADAVNNLSDAANSVVTLVGFRMAGKPADKEHPFGHGRLEDIVGIIIAVSIIILGVEFIRSSVANIIDPPGMDAGFAAIALLVAGFFIKLWMYFYNRRLAREIDSDALMMVAKDSRNDCFINIGTIASLVAAAFFGLYIDGFVGILISLVLLYTGITSAKAIFGNILGKPADKQTAEAIIRIVMSQDGIIGTHDLVVHNYGPMRNVATIHAEMPNDISIVDAHTAIDAAEAAVMSQMGIALTIHLDPVDTDNKQLNDIKAATRDFLAESCPKADAHDFRFIACAKSGRQLIFELELPHGTQNTEIDGIVAEIKERLGQTNPDYGIKINTEFSFVAEE